MKKNTEYPIREIIKYCIDTNFKDDDFCLYGSDSPLEAGKSYLFSDYPQVIDNKDVYPSIVVEKSFSLVYYGEQFVDVLCVALEKNPTASEQELLQAFAYYYQKDDFM